MATYDFDVAPAGFDMAGTGFTNEINPVGTWHWRIWHNPYSHANPYFPIDPGRYSGGFSALGSFVSTFHQYDYDIGFLGLMTAAPSATSALTTSGTCFGVFFNGSTTRTNARAIAPGWIHGTAGLNSVYTWSDPARWINWNAHNGIAGKLLEVSLTDDNRVALSLDGGEPVLSIVAPFELRRQIWTHMAAGPVGAGVGGSQDGNYYLDASINTIETFIDPIDPATIWTDLGSKSPMVMA